MKDITLLKVGETLPINEKMAGIVPMALPEDQSALTDDIRMNGLREPVVTYKGEIVDGRCRQIGCTLAGKPLMSKALDDALTEDEVRIFVKSVNTRRHLSPTQKIMVACRESLKPNSKSMMKIAKSWGISKATLANAKFIANHRPEFIEPLFDGKSVEIVNKHGNEVSSNKVTAIYAYVQRMIDNAKTDDQHAWNPDAQIKTQLGKEWYYDEIKNIGNKVQMQMYLAELANYKFVKQDVENI